MNRIFTSVLAILVVTLPAHGELRIFACEPEWAALASELGQDLVKVYSATTAQQDPHYIQARPSLIAKVRRADLVICSGSELEIGWLPALLNKASNPSVRPGSSGFIEASLLVKRLDIPVSIDRSQGDMHPAGNPHIQMNPHNIARVAQELGKRLMLLDAINSGRYSTNMEDFLARWKIATKIWEKRAAPLKGKQIVPHHKSWAYLENWLGLNEVATLEPVPGIPPTATHLSKLLVKFSQVRVDFIIRTPYQSDKPSRWLSNRTDTPALVLPFTVGGSDKADNLFSLFDDTLDRLLGDVR